MKRCRICKDGFPRTAKYFTRDRTKKDGLDGRCKICKYAYDRTPERVVKNKEAQQRWNKSEHGKTMNTASRKRRGPQQRQMTRAHHVLNRAVKKNEIKHINEMQCAHCSLPAHAYHHWSYLPMHWLDVMPLCRSCHHKVHQGKLSDRPQQLPMF